MRARRGATPSVRAATPEPPHRSDPSTLKPPPAPSPPPQLPHPPKSGPQLPNRLLSPMPPSPQSEARWELVATGAAVHAASGR
eukprot:359718-Chlamydomonas_euryale.AAC.14